MNGCGKKARRIVGGNRHSCKRAKKDRKHKGFTDEVMTPEKYQAMKMEHKRRVK